MPLSTLGGIASTSLSNMQRSFAGIVQPLDAIEARRASRAAEAAEQQKADAASQKAQAQQMAAEEAQAAGEAQRLKEANTREVMGNMPKISVDNMQDPSFTQQLRGQVEYLMNSGDQDAMDVANDIMTQIKTFAETGEIDEGTMQGQRAAASIEADVSQTELNRSMSKAQIPGAGKGDVEWSQAWIHGNDPGRSQGFLSNLFTKNYSPEERIQKGNELASILDQVKREYTAATGGKIMPVEQAQNEAIRRFKESQEGGVDVPQQPQAAPQPVAQPQQQMAPQAPVQQAPAPVQQQGSGKVKFDWSN